MHPLPSADSYILCNIGGNNMFRIYNFYGFFFYLQFIILISLLVFSYISIRKKIQTKDFSKNGFNKKISLIMTISLVVCMVTMFASTHQIQTIHNAPGYIDGGYGGLFGQVISSDYYFFNICYLFIFELAETYLFRIIAIVLYGGSIFLCIKGYKKNKYMYSLISLLIGVIANVTIILDYYVAQGTNILNHELHITFIGIFTFVTSLGSIIYLLITKNKSLQ